MKGMDPNQQLSLLCLFGTTPEATRIKKKMYAKFSKEFSGKHLQALRAMCGLKSTKAGKEIAESIKVWADGFKKRNTGKPVALPPTPGRTCHMAKMPGWESCGQQAVGKFVISDGYENRSHWMCQSHADRYTGTYQ